MNKLNIIQGLDSWYPDVCGPVIVAENYCKILNRENNCSLVVPEFSKKQKKGVSKNFDFPITQVISLPAPEGLRCALPALDPRLNRVIKNRPDILHAHSPFLIGEYFVNLGRFLKIPTVMTFHTKFYDEFLRVTKSKVLAETLTDGITHTIKKADYVLTVSKGAANTLADYGYKGEIGVIRNGTDMTEAKEPDKLLEKINAQYGLAGQQNVLLFVGRIVEVKNLAMALDALKYVSERGVDFKFIIVGDGSAKPSLEEQVKKLNLEQKVIFTGMIRDREFLKGFYLRSDLFLFPSVFDTASLVPIEAATFALPTLLIKDSPTSEIVINNVNGFAAENDSLKFADKICEILADKELLKNVASSSKTQVYRSWEDTVSEVLDFYKEITANNVTVRPKVSFRR